MLLILWLAMIFSVGTGWKPATVRLLRPPRGNWEQRIDRTYGYGAIPRPYRLVVVTRGGALYLAAKEGWAPAAF